MKVPPGSPSPKVSNKIVSDTTPRSRKTTLPSVSRTVKSWPALIEVNVKTDPSTRTAFVSLKLPLPEMVRVRPSSLTWVSRYQ